MFEYFEQFKAIVVTGPQRAGTRIAAKMIAEDTGYFYVDERNIAVDSLYFFVRALRLKDVEKGVVIHCPALCRYVHLFGANEDIAVVMIHRPIDDIIASQDRIDWTRQFEMIELVRYDTIHGPIAKVKYDFWEHYQKHGIFNAFDLNYEDLSKHPLWIDKDEREEFKPHQTELVSA